MKSICFQYSSTISLSWRVCGIAANWMIYWVYFRLFVVAEYLLFVFVCSEDKSLEASIAFSSVISPKLHFLTSKSILAALTIYSVTI